MEDKKMINYLLKYINSSTEAMTECNSSSEWYKGYKTAFRHMKTMINELQGE